MRGRAYGAALTVFACPELEDLMPLSGLTTPLASLSLGYSGRLSSISGPPYAERMSNVWLEQVEGHVDLSALGEVREIDRLAMQGTGIQTLDFLGSLQSATTVDVRTNPSLEDVTGITGIVRVVQLFLWDNPTLRRLPAFPELRSAGTIWISLNATLEQIDGFPQLATLSSDDFSTLRIDHNAALSAVLGLGTIESALDIEIAHNPSLQQIQLGGLRYARTLAITSNPALHTASLPFLADLEAQTLKLGGNSGDPTLLDPCPWLDDGVCDAAPDDTLCAEGSDASDCGAIYD